MSGSTGARTRADQREIEIGHFFGEGDGQTMLEALLDGFTSQHPDVTVQDQSYSNTAHDLEIKCRILLENPPDIFVEWPGNNLKPYIDADVVMDISDLWEESGLHRGFNEGARELVSFEGRQYGVPITIHRKNNLFYNVELAEERGIDPESISDPTEFREVLAQAHGDGVVGMAQPMKNPWTVLQLWSQILIGEAGADAYDDIAAGNAREYEREIRESIQLLDDYAAFGHENTNFQGMVGANDAFIDGEAVFFHQGDWVAGAYAEVEGFDYQSEWDHVPFPGTEDTYVMGMDSIVAPAAAEDPETSKTFLDYVASKEALKTINGIKGSIPPRGDISLDDFPTFLQHQYRDFNRVRNHTGGQKSMVLPDTGIEQRLAFSTFIAERDIEQTVEELIAGYY